IRNMVAVQEVISSLEKYPITKEALEVSISGLSTREGSEGQAWAAPTQVFPGFLEPQRLCSLAQRGLKRSEGGVPSWPALCQPTAHAPRVPSSHRHCRKWETRLGKLINDVRKKTKNEELAKRAKKLLRSWQKLIEPVHQNEAALRGLGGAPGSANGGAHNCRPEAGVAGPPKSIHDLKNRNDIQRLPGQRLDRLGSRKRRGDQRDLGHPGPPPKVSKVSHDSLVANSRLEHSENDKHSGKIPVNAVRPHTSSPGLGKPPGPCLQTKAARSPYTYKGSVPSPSPRPQSLDATQVPSPLPLAQPSTPPVRRLELLPSAESPADSDAASSGGSDSKKKKRYRPRDYTVNLDGQVAEAGVKPVRLKERKLTFDPMTRQIKPLTQKEPVRADSPVHTEQPRTELDKPEAKASLQSPFEQTNWKELSRNEIIQSYLSRQSSLLSSSGAQTPGAHHFMSEYLKQEESTRRGARKPHVLVPHGPPTDLPGLSREVTQDDLDRIQAHQWPGVNGCQDTQGNWYDWTQCISLDPHGDDGRLNILPYVCLD
ncbi:hypothetical protein E2I00_018618, partial [Balaenoptera physalus]